MLKENIYTYEKCKEEALKYKSILEFKKCNRTAYGIVCKNKWGPDIYSHMIRPKPTNFKWDYDSCKEEALKYFQYQ